MMRADDPPKPTPPTAPTVRTTIAIAVATAALTTLATKLVEWGLEEIKTHVRGKDGEES